MKIIFFKYLNLMNGSWHGKQNLWVKQFANR